MMGVLVLGTDLNTSEIMTLATLWI